MTASNKSPGQASLPTPVSTASFWHSESSKILLGHRTTPELPTVTDVVIIGSGISGTSAAYHLSQDAVGKNLNVVMLEAREACWGATGRNGGHCQPMMLSAPEVGAFELRNYQAIKDLIEEHNIPCDWRAFSGVHSFLSKDMFDSTLAVLKALLSANPSLAEFIKIIYPTSKNPSLSDLKIPTAAGAFMQTNAASLWPYKFVSFLLERLLSNNPSPPPSESSSKTQPLPQSFNLQTQTPVVAINRHHTSAGSFWFVHTSRGQIACTDIILATNGYTSALLPSFSDLIVPVKGEMSALLPPSSFLPGLLNHAYGFIGHGKQNINQDDYLIQRTYGKKEFMYGGGRAQAPHAGVGISDDSTTDEEAAGYLRRELPVVLDLGEKEELEASYEWSGIMGYSRDSHPWVGALTKEIIEEGDEGLWIAGGYTGHGMPNAWLSGKAVSEMVLGKEGDLPSIYRVSKERIERARALKTVAIADKEGLLVL